MEDELQNNVRSRSTRTQAWSVTRDERRSELWKYAKVDYVEEQKLLVCNVDLGGRVCGQSFGWTGPTSLSNFRRHLRNRHAEIKLMISPSVATKETKETVEEAPSAP